MFMHWVVVEILVKFYFHWKNNKISLISLLLLVFIPLFLKIEKQTKKEKQKSNPAIWILQLLEDLYEQKFNIYMNHTNYILHRSTPFCFYGYVCMSYTWNKKKKRIDLITKNTIMKQNQVSQNLWLSEAKVFWPCNEYLHKKKINIKKVRKKMWTQQKDLL